MVSQYNQVNMDTQPTSSEVQIFNQIKRCGSHKEQLKKTASEFEAVFVSKMLNLLDKTVERDEESVFGKEGDYLKTFKSYMFNEMARDIAKNPKTSFGFASQIYKQMEKNIQD
ncbi:MAG: hypothetical protein PHV37_09320 [Candidatus Gastranaerophilales bacterium]|nr:hypothetical protein [Candidatus Gastranaerophilales bacterium]